MARPGPERRRDEREPESGYPRTNRPPEPRYGVISPSDDLAWPDAQPVDADWQPAAPRRGRSSGRGTSPSARQSDSYGQRDDGPGAASRGYRPDEPAWAGGEPDPGGQWQDDLAYDAYQIDDEPGHDDDRGTGYPEDVDADGPWRDDSRDANPVDPDAQDTGWDQPDRDDDPPDGWAGREPAGGFVGDIPAGDDPRAAVFGAPERPARRPSGPREGIRPPVWGLSGYAWRFARRLTIPRVNRLLRLGANRVLPASSRERFLEMRLPQAEVEETLRQIRSLNDWAEAWTGTAQRFLGETRRGGEMTPADAAHSRQMAALCYHVASFFAFGDDRLARTSRSASTTLFTQSLGLILPETRTVNVRWRSRTMPGYLTVPSWATGRRPLAVLLNGTTTSREELILWSDEFLAQGLAVLALDTPGFAEGSALGPVSLDNDDIMDGIFELAESDPGLDPTKVSLVGISLGGTMALRAAAQERRVAAVVAVTPPYEPARWLGASSPVSLAQLVPLFGGYDQLADFVLGLDMPATLAAIPGQVLVFGAGHDLVVPPPEASRLAAALGDQATLVWFDDAGHALFDVLPEWTREAAEWLAVVMDVTDAPIIAEQSQEQDEPPVPPAADDGQPTDMGEATAEAEWIPPSSAPAEAPPPPRPTMARRPPAARNPNAAGDRPAPTMARQPEPEPYGAEVFDSRQAEERRAGQQRGYETGVFGPLGPAAARILADEPTPEPGSPEWGYDDERERSDRDTGPAFSTDPPRQTPSTSRLWQTTEPPSGQRPPGSTGFRPVMARTNEQVTHPEVASSPSGEQPAAPGNPTPDYLSPTSPSVGRGRTSEPFRTVPATEPELAGQAQPSAKPRLAAEPAGSKPGAGASGLDPAGSAAPGNAVLDQAAGAMDTDSSPETSVDDGSAGTDGHAAFRPPNGQPD